MTDSAFLLPVKTVYRVSGSSPLDRPIDNEEDPLKINTTSINPAMGAVIYFHIKNKDSVKNLSIEILDADKKIIRTYYKDKPKNKSGNNSEESDPAINVRSGLNRFVWDLSYANVPTVPNVFIEGSYHGRKVIPGTYEVKLTVNGHSHSSTLQVLPDPRINATAQDYKDQEELSRLVSTDVESIHVAVVQMRKIQEQFNQFIVRAEGNKSLEAIVKQARTINKNIKDWELLLIQPKSQSNDDVINFVNKLSANLIFLNGEIDGSNVPYVSAGSKKRYEDLHAQWLTFQSQQQLLENDIKKFNEDCRKANWDIIGVEFKSQNLRLSRCPINIFGSCRL